MPNNAQGYRVLVPNEAPPAARYVEPMTKSRGSISSRGSKMNRPWTKSEMDGLVSILSSRVKELGFVLGLGNKKQEGTDLLELFFEPEVGANDDTYRTTFKWLKDLWGPCEFVKSAFNPFSEGGGVDEVQEAPPINVDGDVEQRHADIEARARQVIERARARRDGILAGAPANLQAPPMEAPTKAVITVNPGKVLKFKAHFYRSGGDTISVIFY